ncbi:MAG: DNA polymerase III subunit [Colwellia sp.]
MHSAIKEHQQLLSQQYKQQTLPHAILFSGAIGVGKTDLSDWLIKLLLCNAPNHDNSADMLVACGTCKNCRLFESGNYPDHFEVQPKSKSTSLGVDEIRLANEFLQKTAHIGQFQSVLVNNAQSMTTQAANALLKTLEEPTPHSVIILNTDEIDLLLPTIISRCRVIHVKGLVADQLLASLTKSSGNSNSSFNALQNDTFNEVPYLNSSHLTELKDPNKAEQYTNFKSLICHFLMTARVERSLTEAFNDNNNAYAWLEKVIVNLSRLKQTHDNTELYLVDDIQLKLLPNSEILNQIYKIVTQRSKLAKNYIQANQQYLTEKLLVDISHLLKV